MQNQPGSPHVTQTARTHFLEEDIKLRDSATIVIFGASGDLSKRKLIPALWKLYEAGHLPDSFLVVGFSRSPMSDQAFRERMLEELKQHTPDLTCEHPFLRSLYYVAGDSNNIDSFRELSKRLAQLEEAHNVPGNRLYYYAVAPQLFSFITQHLHEAGMITQKNDTPWTRLVVEKPFGHDLQSAHDLNEKLQRYVDESQLYRIDHYLGKETVQNILAFRFGNAIFEPLLNQKYVDHIQITAAESLGMEGRRGYYYDRSGALRDMVQNHMMQLLTLITMEPPSGMDSDAIRDEKVKVLRSIMPMHPNDVARHTVRAQYTTVKQDGKTIHGYKKEEGVDPESQTETYAAIRLQIDNWRWAGVPILMRTGKRLLARQTEIAITFKLPPLQFFRKETQPNVCLLSNKPRPNRLIFRIQPDEGISLSFGSKTPGMQLQIEDVKMNFFYPQAFEERLPEAYERLLLDALRGDTALFTRADEVELAWRFISSIHEG